MLSFDVRPTNLLYFLKVQVKTGVFYNVRQVILELHKGTHQGFIAVPRETVGETR